jgi:hypothetical protein
MKHEAGGRGEWAGSIATWSWDRDRPRWQNYAEAPTAAKQKADYEVNGSAGVLELAKLQRK